MHCNMGRGKNNRMSGGDDHRRSTRGEAEEDARSQNKEQQCGSKKIGIHL